MVSKEFLNSFSCGGNDAVSCGCCGRMNYAQTNVESENRRREQRARENPNVHVYHPELDTVCCVDFLGVSYVVGCPCGELDKLEARILEDRQNFIKYLRAVKERETRASVGVDSL
jgi:hypothetical protein